METTTRRILIGAVTGFAFGVFVYTAVTATVFAPETAVVIAEAPHPLPESPGMIPVKLLIPQLEIDAPVEEVGVTARGNMATPSRYSSVGWYKYGTLPGARGSAVLAGHVDNALGLAGVFKRLSELSPGDEIFVTGAGGEELRFTIERMEIYPYQEVPVETLFKDSDAARLNLVTCSGSWLLSEKTYDERLVVYAVLDPL